ncbi:MAG: putative capsular polysaccharide synthesis family protein [Halioglobus sp.]|nr:putative capsular polysaccharide synthesis family protein [Halioglobus sp.]
MGVIPVEILIFQMGKVASTAIADALRREGRSALQAHIASPHRLQGKLEILTSAGVSNGVAHRMYEDYLQELKVTFLLSRKLVSGASEGPPTRVISLTRDPLSWYLSHFAQNYDHYSTLLKRYHENHCDGSGSFSPEETFREIQSCLFDVLMETREAIDSADALPRLMAEADLRDATNVVFSQLNRFLLPLRWFDEDFLPATGVDVFSHDFDRQRGIGQIDLPGLSILLLRYENLLELSDSIAEFVGLQRLRLCHTNVSEDKGLPIDLKSMQDWLKVRIPPELKERIYGTRYARHFGYSADTICNSLN